MSGTPNASAIGGPFKLIDQNGNPITDADINGRPFLVFFGYTHCPDVCPTTLADLTVAMRKLPEADAAKVDTVMVTVDPDRVKYYRLNACACRSCCSWWA